MTRNEARAAIEAMKGHRLLPMVMFWMALDDDRPLPDTASAAPDEAPSSPEPGEGDHAQRGGRGSSGKRFESSISPPTGFAGPPSPDGEGRIPLAASPVTPAKTGVHGDTLMRVRLWQLADDCDTYGWAAGWWIVVSDDGEIELSQAFVDEASAAQYAKRMGWVIATWSDVLARDHVEGQ